MAVTLFLQHILTGFPKGVGGGLGRMEKISSHFSFFTRTRELSFVVEIHSMHNNMHCADMLYKSNIFLSYERSRYMILKIFHVVNLRMTYYYAHSP
jgi:hypothetical protein